MIPALASISVPADGDVLRAEITGNVIKVYKNGTLVATTRRIDYGPAASRAWASGR